MNDKYKPHVLVFDPHRLRRAGFVRLLEGWATENRLEIIAVSGLDELPVASSCAMVLLSIGARSFLEAEQQASIRSIRMVMQDVPLVILSDLECCCEVRTAFKEGAKGFISTNIDPNIALEALTFVYRGGSYFPASVLLDDEGLERSLTIGADDPINVELPPRPHDAMEAHHRAPRAIPRVSEFEPETRDAEHDDEVGSSLTPRQQEVLEKLHEGKSNKVIARDLEMTEATVKVHVRHIMRKFGATNRTQVVLSSMRVREKGQP